MITFLLSLKYLILVHAFHVSMTEINLIPEKQSAQIILSVFANDLEKAITNQFGKDKLDIFDASNYSNNTIWIEKYLQDKFYFKDHEKKLSLKYLGFEQVENRCFIFMEIPAWPKEWKSLKMKNAVLLELFVDQKNMIHLFNDKRQSSYLTSNKSSWIEL